MPLSLVSLIYSTHFSSYFVAFHLLSGLVLPRHLELAHLCSELEDRWGRWETACSATTVLLLRSFRLADCCWFTSHHLLSLI